MQKPFLALLLVAAISAHAAPKTKSSHKPKVDPIEQAHERVRDLLKDPDSAKFRSEFIGKDGAVCGFVNSKNSYGGYAGFTRYVVNAETARIDSLDPKEWWKMDSYWGDWCADFEPVR